MKAGDYVVIKGHLVKILFEDMEYDLWHESFDGEGDSGSNFKRAFKEDLKRGEDFGCCSYFIKEHMVHFEDHKIYNFFSDFNAIYYTKIKLTRLARKVYNLPDDFNGDIWVLKGGSDE